MNGNEDCRCGLPWSEHGSDDTFGPKHHYPRTEADRRPVTAPLPPVPAEVLTRLEELHKAATPGPWTPATAPSEDSGETHAEYLTGALRPEEGRPLWVAWAPVVEGLHDDSDYVIPVVTGDGPAAEANARFIAAAHDHVPALLAAVRGVLALAEEAKRASTYNDWHALAARLSAVAAALGETGGGQ